MSKPHDEVDVERLVSYLVGEIWPRFAAKFNAETLEVYEVLTKLTRVFVLPKEASPDQLQWFTGLFVELPDLVAWVLNELSVESEKLTRWDLNTTKSDVGALRFLVLIGIKNWSRTPELTETGAMQEAACQILNEEHSAVERRFENVIKKVREREESHLKAYRKLVEGSVPRYRSVAETYPVIGEQFPDLVETLDKAAREPRIRESILGGISVMRRAMKEYAEALLRATASEDESDEGKEN